MTWTSEHADGPTPSELDLNAHTSAIRLLAVDDEPAVLRTLRTLFRGSAYELHLAESGARALELLSEHPFDVIISDMRMPEMDGRAFLAEARRRFPEPMRIVLSAYAEPDRVIGVLNEGGIFAYVNKPWDNADLKLKVHRAAEQLRLKRLTERQNAELARLNQSLEIKVRQRTAQLESARDRLEEAMHDLEESYGSVVRMLAHVTELRMPTVHGHGQRVARTARRLAEERLLSHQQIRDIETAAMLQDIGLVVASDALLSLPPERMSQAQREQFRRHPILGEITLLGIPAMRQVARIIRSHHECYDGSGFPDSLSGDSIPLGARIVTLASDYQALLEGQLTGSALPASTVYERLRRDAGHRYDPQLIELLARLGQQPSTNGQIQIEDVRTLHSEDLESGMVMYEKLLSKDGMLLLNAGQRVTDEAIDAIRRLEQDDGSRYLLYVYDHPSDQHEPVGLTRASNSDTEQHPSAL